MKNSGQVGRVSHALGQVVQNASPTQAMTALRSVPLQEIPVAYKADLTFQVPIQDSTAGGAVDQVKAFWGQSKINPLAVQSVNTNLGIVGVDNDFSGGQALATDLLLMGIGVTLEGEDEEFIVGGVDTASPGGKHASPDVFTAADIASGTVLDTDVVKAYMAWGRYTWSAARNFADGTNMVFKIADRLHVVDEPSYNIASCGTKQHSRGFSNSLIDTGKYVNIVNQAYASLPGGNPFGASTRFISQNLIRTGLDPATGLSTFDPTYDAGNLAEVAFGAIPNHPLYSNPCWKLFDTPLLMKAGLPFEVYFEEGNSTYFQRLLSDLGSTNGTTVDADTTVAYTEWDNHSAPPGAAAPNTRPSGVHIYKGGNFRFSVCFYGFMLFDKAVSEAFSQVGAQMGNVGGIIVP